MNNIDQQRLARLRPDKLDDVAVKEQISLIQRACGNVSPEKIALVFHECEYNMQLTISRIRAGDYEDGGWQTAKSNNKKKNNTQVDQKQNGNNLSDSERSLSQRTSPTSSLRGGYHRNGYYQYPPSTRSNFGRRGYDSGRNSFMPSNLRYSHRNKPIRKATSSQPIFNEASLTSQQSNDEPPQAKSPSTDEYEFADGIPQSLSFDNSQMKTSLQSLSKRRIPSTIPQEPVSMHPTVQLPSEPLDIQFGDVQWNDSVPIAVSPLNDTVLSTMKDQHEEDNSTTEDNPNIQDSATSNYMNAQINNDIDNPLIETTNQLSSLSITDSTMSNSLSVIPPEVTSHLSDHLADPSSTIPNPYPSQPQIPIPIPIPHLPPSSTTHVPEPSVTNSPFILSSLQPSNNGITSSAFTPFNTNVNYSTLPRDYSQVTPTNWNPQGSNYKTNPKPTMIQTGAYQPQTYQIPAQQQQQQQQQFFVGHYPYAPLSPGVVPVYALDQWQGAAYPTPFESYSYPTTGYIAYPNQLQSYDNKEFFAHYGQTRSLNNDATYQQQSIKDTHVTSKLSPNAATFCQGAPLTASTTTPTALYINPTSFTMSNYFPTLPGAIPQDRILSSVDNRDNRNGASYSSTHNRNNYYHAQQRTHNNNNNNNNSNNGSNSAWHSQQ